VSALGGTVTITGSGFGQTVSAFNAGAITAIGTAGAVSVNWISDTQLALTLPSGVIGSVPVVTLIHDGIAGKPFSGVHYCAVISASSAGVGASTGGWSTALGGVGLAGSSAWALRDSTGKVVVSLPVYPSLSALNSAVGGGVLLSSNTAATVRLPGSPNGDGGVYRLTFSPNSNAYPGATYAFTSKAVIVYADLG